MQNFLCRSHLTLKNSESFTKVCHFLEYFVVCSIISLFIFDCNGSVDQNILSSGSFNFCNYCWYEQGALGKGCSYFKTCVWNELKSACTDVPQIIFKDM